MGLHNSVIINVPITSNYDKICTIINMFYKGKAKFVIETMGITEKIQTVLNLWKTYGTRYILRCFSFQFIGWIFAQSGCTNKPMKTHSLHWIMVFAGLGMGLDEWEEDRAKCFFIFADTQLTLPKTWTISSTDFPHWLISF